MSFGSDSDVSYRRQSSIVRAASSLRQSAATAVTAVEEHIEVGTVGGTVLNTTCNVIGAGVLALPLAAHHAGLGWIIVFVIAVGFIGAFSAYVLFIGCERSGAFFMNEIFAISIVGRPKHDPTTSSISDDDAADTDSTPTKVVATNSDETDTAEREEEDPIERSRNRARLVLSMIIDLMILANNYTMLAVYTRIIIDSIPPVLEAFLHADGIWISDWFWAALAGCIFFGLTSVRNMAELKWSSILGIVTIMYAVLAVIIDYGRFGYQGKDVVTQQPDTPELQAFPLKAELPTAMATLSVAFSYHFNAPIFYHELQDRTPRKMMKTVGISFPIIGTTYILIAVFGYLSFGKHVGDKSAGGEIVNNYPMDSTLFNTVRLGLFFHFACVYPVMSVCVRHSFHRIALTLMGKRKEAMHPDMPARVPRPVIVLEAFAIVSSACVFAYFCKDIGKLIVYVGAVSGSNIMLTVPGIIGVCIWSSRPAASGNERLPLMFQKQMDLPVATTAAPLSLATAPPPHYEHRGKFIGCSIFIILLGLSSSIASFAAAVLSS